MTVLRRQCPPGFILRKGYTRKYRPSIAKIGYTRRHKGKVTTVRPPAKSIHVSEKCIKDRGLPGKGPREGKGIGKLRKGKLIRYGYSYHLSDGDRQNALDRAIKQYGALEVYHMLDAVAKYSVRTAPDAHIRFVADRDYVKKHYELKKP